MLEETQTTKAYRLKEPIDNPSPSRRIGWKHGKRFPAGIYRVRKTQRSFEGTPLDCTYEISPVGDTMTGMATTFRDGDKVEALLAHLVEEGNTLEGLRARDAFDLLLLDTLQELVDTGKVSVDAVAEAYETVYDRGGE